MKKIEVALDCSDTIRLNAAFLDFRPASAIEMIPFNLTPEESHFRRGWKIGSVETPRGTEVVIVRRGDAHVLVYDNGTLAQPRQSFKLHRFWQSQDGDTVKETPEDELDDTYFDALTEGLDDKASLVEMGQFYYRDGFLRLECSNDLPAQLMAQALLAAFNVLKFTADVEIGGFNPERAHT